MNTKSLTESLVCYLERHRYLTLALAIIVISASVFLGWNFYDIMWWLRWCEIAEKHSILEVYAICTPPNCKVPYPPLAVLLFVSSYSLAKAIAPSMAIPIVKLLLVLIPGIIVFYILYRLRGLNAAILWIFSFPFIQLLIALQFDVIIALLILVSTIMLWMKRYSISALLLAMATMVKQAIALILPITLYIAYRRSNMKSAIQYLVVYLIVVSAIAVPFIVIDFKAFVNNVLLFHSRRIPQDLSLWAIPTILYEFKAAEISFLRWGWILFFSAAYIALLYLIHRLKAWKSLEGIALSIAIALLIFIAMNKIGNFNYLVWIVPTAILGLYGISRAKGTFFVALLSASILFGWAPYIALLYLPPAILDKPIFVPEDLALWNARYLFMHFINNNVFNIPAKLGLISAPITPLDILERTSSLFLKLYELRKPLMLLTLFIGQSFIVTALVYLLKCYRQLALQHL